MLSHQAVEGRGTYNLHTDRYHRDGEGDTSIAANATRAAIEPSLM